MSDTVQIRLGPLDAAAVESFTREVEELLANFAAHEQLRQTFTPAIGDAIRTYLTEWRATARDAATFDWEGDVDAAVAEYLLYATFLGVEQVRRFTGGEPLQDERSDVGRPLLRLLIARLHAALRDVPDADQDRLGYLEERWPPDLFPS